jgi:hypothetical protein
VGKIDYNYFNLTGLLAQEILASSNTSQLGAIQNSSRKAGVLYSSMGHGTNVMF